MKKWTRRILLSLLLLIAAGLVLSAVGMRMFRAAPTWYARPASTPEQRAELARAAENKLIHAQNWAAALRADAQRAARAGTGAGTGAATLAAGSGDAAGAAATATRPATRAAATHVLSVSEDELNALFDKWSAAYGWRGKYSEHLQDPTIVLRDGRLILAGMLKEIGSVVSFQFAPSLDAQGKLRLDLARVTGGRLPLPQALWTPYRDRLAQSVRENLPRWRAGARIDRSGAANGAMMAATMGELFLNVASSAPAEPVLFLPLAGGGDSVPVRVRDVAIANGTLDLTVEPMVPAEREALLRRVRDPQQPTAQALNP